MKNEKRFIFFHLSVLLFCEENSLSPIYPFCNLYIINLKSALQHNIFLRLIPPLLGATPQVSLAIVKFNTQNLTSVNQNGTSAMENKVPSSWTSRHCKHTSRTSFANNFPNKITFWLPEMLLPARRNHMKLNLNIFQNWK